MSFFTFQLCLVAYVVLEKIWQLQRKYLSKKQNVFIYFYKAYSFYCKSNIYIYAENLENKDKKNNILLPKYNLTKTCNILEYILSGFFLSICI